MSNTILCPKCGSNQVTANKKGFSGTKAIAGAVLTGGVGLLAGTIGSGKVIITCLSCGSTFKPGTKPSEKIVKAPTKAQETEFFYAVWIFSIMFSIFTYSLFSNGHGFFGTLSLIITIILLALALFATSARYNKD